ncbi:putative methyltransferase, type 11 [Desulfosarcina variabilis str. Montpellier]|uniref:class I SAM-dependent methyltransferase n=1 Tax=Desulfosarcina variabilis TaxID=2300 RepID=UPI003AFA7C33
MISNLSNCLRFKKNISIDYEYVTGKKLFGDDMCKEDILLWYKQEADGYSSLLAQRQSKYRYPYFALNHWLFWKHILPMHLEHVLGFGSAFGHELLPIAARSKRITILDPGEGFLENTVLANVSIDYVKPTLVGRLPFRDGSFDLITCFGVLHHIPNVSYVLKEFYRCCKKGALVLLREPTTSLGGWWNPRPRLTVNERGIPLEIMRKLLLSVGFQVEHEQRCMTTVTPRINRILRLSGYNSRIVVYIDLVLSIMLSWNKVYHPRNILEKFRPGAVAYILRRT